LRQVGASNQLALQEQNGLAGFGQNGFDEVEEAMGAVKLEVEVGAFFLGLLEP